MSERKSVDEERMHRPGFRGWSNAKKWETLNRLMEDAVDTHINMGQDYTGDPLRVDNPVDRPFDDIDIAVRASEAGMKAIVFTCHIGPGFFRVPLIQKVVDEWAQETGKRGVKIIGTVTLNNPMGGLNPEVVRMLVRFGGKVVCLPSFDGSWTRQRLGLKGGIDLVKRGKVVPELEEIIGIAADSNLVMDISMAEPEQRLIIFDEAKKAGVKGFYVFNPMMRGTEEQWVELARKGLKLAYIHGWMDGATFDQAFKLLKKVGVESCVSGTDLNNWPNIHPVDGLRVIATKLLMAGLSESEVEKMYKVNPAKLLDL